VSPTQIHIAITLINIVGPAGNATFGVPSTGQQQSYFQDVVNAINASGGVACRKLVPTFFQVDPADQSDEQTKCLDMAQARVFAVIDVSGYNSSGDPAAKDCFAQQQIPLFYGDRLAQKQSSQFYPFLFGGGTFDTLYRNTVFGLKARGFFSPASGFQNLGFLYRDCEPEIPNEFVGWLKQVGLSSSQIVTYDVGCPSGYADPSVLEQAILKFQQNHVTSVTEAMDYADYSNFTTIAQQQGFHPRYGFADDGIVPLTYGAQHPNYSNIANAIAITSDRYGEELTPGFRPSPGTSRCNAIFSATRTPPVYQQPNGFGGTACDLLAMFSTAVGHAPALERRALAAGLQAAPSIDFSYPWGPGDFAGSGVTTGGEFWRVDQFFTTCGCWRVTDPTFHSSF
jgi:hypothetical protein